MSLTLDDVLKLATTSESPKVRRLAERLRNDAQTLVHEVHAAREARRSREDAAAEVRRLLIELDNAQRRAAKGRRQALCGTDSGYYRHRRSGGEEACEKCKTAHSLAERARTERLRQAAEKAYAANDSLVDDGSPRVDQTVILRGDK